MRADKLDKAVQGFLALMQERHDVLGAMLTGSYVTGTMMPHSDIDVFFIWQDEGRSMRGCTVFEGVAFEYFFSPVWKYRDRLKKDLVAQQIYAKGRIVLDTGGVFQAIKEEALRRVAAYAPVLSPQDRADLSFQVETVMKDGLDLQMAGRGEDFRFLAGKNIPFLCDVAAKVHKQYPVYQKYAMEQLRALDPSLAAHLRSLYQAAAGQELLAAWQALCSHVLGLLGDVDNSNYQSVVMISEKEST